ncbi:oxygen-insensitive NADPH nitroreductase [Brevibacillus composti]|uniref:Oxygen-insensitive NADPH nitroreductase n=1 Tax=Brevibacillus composti TaxID=2796470 RepID=A0A7T5ENR6_9BACL|nr:oxygen-insensitive NADPH nitroreductase [Brevibacillus composti]QQE75967.1 oxygen-insensitive NADPH nitroreductase [Brevibacillus composti]QUO42993.1 oxygen-insensitive NADPH nitroreductase [Brevibacillus composti]
MQTEVTQLMQSHRSIRRYTDEPIPEEVLADILACAQWAPSSHNVQAYSIIVIRSAEKKKQLAQYCGGQRWVENCPVFLVFCADFYRLKLACDMHGTDLAVDEVENLLVAAVDTALAAENTLVAARSHGLGGVMIGGIRNQPEEVARLLNLPPLTTPIMGMCLGYPDQDVAQKPRVPARGVIHEEEYRTEHLAEVLEEYEAISSAYYAQRTGGERAEGWTKQMADYLQKPRRPHLSAFLRQQGFPLK